MIDYCLNHNLPIKASQDKPYSTDSNLLALTHEGGKLENLTTPMNFVSPELGQWPIDANEQGENIRLAFRKGVPVKLNNTTIDKITLYKTLNTIGGRHGIGIAVNVIENRITGIKSRGVYESPAMTILGECYQSLLQQILDKFTLDIFTDFSKELGNRLYQGYWDDLGSVMLKNAICPVTQLVSGTIEVNLYKGNISYVSCEDVIHSIYTLDGSMENEGSFNHTDSEGLLNIYTLSVRNASKARTFGSHNDEQ